MQQIFRNLSWGWDSALQLELRLLRLRGLGLTAIIRPTFLYAALLSLRPSVHLLIHTDGEALLQDLAGWRLTRPGSSASKSPV